MLLTQTINRNYNTKTLCQTKAERCVLTKYSSLNTKVTPLLLKQGNAKFSRHKESDGPGVSSLDRIRIKHTPSKRIQTGLTLI